jgi:hypothetical protein
MLLRTKPRHGWKTWKANCLMNKKNEYIVSVKDVSLVA